MKKGIPFILLGAALWGMIPLFSRLAYAYGSDPVTAGAWRVYLAAGIFLIWFLVDGTLRSVRLKEIPFYLVYGLFGVGGTVLFYMMAVERLSTPMAAMLLYTAPAFVILFDRIFYREPITRIRLASLLCTLFGCFFVVRAYDIGNFNLPGVLIGLASGLSYSMVTVMGRKANQLHDGRTNAGFMFFAGAVFFCFLQPPWSLEAPSLPLLGGYLGLALCCSVGAYTAYLYGMRCGVPGGMASITATAEPVVATLLGVFLLGEDLELLQVLGILIVLFGVALPFLADRKRIREPD